MIVQYDMSMTPSVIEELIPFADYSQFEIQIITTIFLFQFTQNFPAYFRRENIIERDPKF
jgi:hypothetical protein